MFSHIARSLALRACLVLALSHNFLQVELTSSPISEACEQLSATFGSIVQFPGSQKYEFGQNQYWSKRQSDARPACRVAPRSTAEVSHVMQVLHQAETDFTIANGKHMTALGASNGNDLVVLDLSELTSIEVDIRNTTVELGTGAMWSDVYEVLDPESITVAGARAGSVGVGGFLLGGGISTLASEYGWSCDAVVSAEVVLGNGTILIANATQHSSLLSALCGGASSFGVVTKFTQRVYKYDILEVGFVGYEWEQLQNVIGLMVDYYHKHQDHKSAIELSLAHENDGRPFAFLLITRYGEIRESSSLMPLLHIPHSSLQISRATPRELALNLDQNNPKGYRQHKVTFTIRNRQETATAIARIFEHKTSAGALFSDPAFRSGMLLQAVPRSHGKYLISLDNEYEALLLISFEARWSRSDLDVMYVNLLNDLLAHCEGIARSRGDLHPFVYRNYASSEQDVWAYLRQEGGIEDITRLQRMYDADQFLLQHLKQPFLLPD